LVLHGPPGIGKETIGSIVSSRLGWPRLSYHDLCAPFAPVFGWGTYEFERVRDDVVPVVVNAALELPLPGIVLTYIFDRTVNLLDFDGYAEEADTAFVGLTCDREEHLRRASSDARRLRGKWIAPDDLVPRLDADEWRFPALPGESHVIDTTGRTPETVADQIVALL
jgi:hypothetical protein